MGSTTHNLTAEQFFGCILWVVKENIYARKTEQEEIRWSISVI